MNIPFKHFFVESANKFHLNWQKVRTAAKSLKDIDSKINLVFDYLHKYPNIHNYGRIENWLKTSKMAKFNDPDKDKKFDKAISYLINNKDKFLSEEDPDISMEDTPIEILKSVYDDLRKRTYNFQMKGKIPKAHLEFENKLKTFLKDKGVNVKDRA